MKTCMRDLILTAFLAVAATLSAADKTQDRPAKATSWKITGDLEEACSCAAACPCWFDSKPTRATCDGFQALFIRKGSYGKTRLDGLAMASTVQSPPGQSMMESFGKWRFSYLYLDDKATPDQRTALRAVAEKVLPVNSSSKIKIMFVPITRTIAGQEHNITVGKVCTVRGHLVPGGLKGAPRIVNPPGADPIHKEYDQGRTTVMTYADAGQNWHLTGTNYMQGKFKVDSDEYQTYAAGLSQKMAGMKK